MIYNILYMSLWSTKNSLLCLLFIAILISNCASSPHKKEDQYGIRVQSLRLTANGNLLDFRYKVIDPEKAHDFFKRENRPYLIEKSTGVRAKVPNMPKIGPLRQSAIKPEADKVYFILFANPGKLIKKGSKVTLHIGDSKIEDLVVE